MIDLITSQDSVIKEPNINFSEDNPILSKAIISCDKLEKEREEEEEEEQQQQQQQQQQQPEQHQPLQDGLAGLPSLSSSIHSLSPSEEVMCIDSRIEMPTALAVDETGSSYCSSTELSELGFEHNGTPIEQSAASFLAFRLNYLVVTLVIGLANGLQGAISQRTVLGGGECFFSRVGGSRLRFGYSRHNSLTLSNSFIPCNLGAYLVLLLFSRNTLVCLV
jgi:hypothetical protein